MPAISAARRLMRSARLLVAAGERLLAGAVGGEAAGGCIGGGLGSGKPVGRGLQSLRGGGAVDDLAGERLCQVASFAVEAVETVCGIAFELARPGGIVSCLGKAAGEFLAPPLSLLFLALETGALSFEAAQRCGTQRRHSRAAGKRRLGLIMAAARLREVARCLGELPDHAFERCLLALDDGQRLQPAGIKLHRLEPADGSRQLAVFQGMAGLTLEAAELLGELADDVVEPDEIVLGGLELQLGVVATGVEPVMPAASSRMRRRACGLALMISPIWPWRTRPASGRRSRHRRNSSWTSRARASRPLMR
jgi:hypothetical protein